MVGLSQDMWLSIAMDVCAERGVLSAALLSTLQQVGFYVGLSFKSRRQVHRNAVVSMMYALAICWLQQGILQGKVFLGSEATPC